VTDDPLCGYCQMPRSKHCKGNQTHTHYKEDVRMVEAKWRKGTHVCHTRHCLAPLCDCVDFVEPSQEDGNQEDGKSDVTA
jgi:hypothetical protein